MIGRSSPREDTTSLRAAVRVVAFEGDTERGGSGLVGWLRQLRREKPERFEELLRVMGYRASSAASARIVSPDPLAGRGSLDLRGWHLEALEREAVVQALARRGLVQKAAAADLGISPRVLHYKLRVLGIPWREIRRQLQPDTAD